MPHTPLSPMFAYNEVLLLNPSYSIPYPSGHATSRYSYDPSPYASTSHDDPGPSLPSEWPPPWSPCKPTSYLFADDDDDRYLQLEDAQLMYPPEDAVCPWEDPEEPSLSSSDASFSSDSSLSTPASLPARQLPALRGELTIQTATETPSHDDTVAPRDTSALPPYDTAALSPHAASALPPQANRALLHSSRAASPAVSHEASPAVPTPGPPVSQARAHRTTAAAASQARAAARRDTRIPTPERELRAPTLQRELRAPTPEQARAPSPECAHHHHPTPYVHGCEDSDAEMETDGEQGSVRRSSRLATVTGKRRRAPSPEEDSESDAGADEYEDGDELDTDSDDYDTPSRASSSRPRGSSSSLGGPSRKKRRVADCLFLLPPTRSWVCGLPACGQAFTREADLQRHVATVPHGEGDLTDEQVAELFQEEREDQRRWCGWCFDILARADSRRRHEETYCLVNPRAKRAIEKRRKEEGRRRARERAAEKARSGGGKGKKAKPKPKPKKARGED